MSPEDRNLAHPVAKPITLDAIPLAWIRQVRFIALRDGHNFRQGGLSFRPEPVQTGVPTIEVRDKLQNWRPLNLPNNQCAFADAGERDSVYEMLQGVREIPADPPPVERDRDTGH